MRLFLLGFRDCEVLSEILRFSFPTLLITWLGLELLSPVVIGMRSQNV